MNEDPFELFGCSLTQFTSFCRVNNAKGTSKWSWNDHVNESYISGNGGQKVYYIAQYEELGLFKAYSDERWSYYQTLILTLPTSYISLQKVGRMYFLNLGVKI